MLFSSNRTIKYHICRSQSIANSPETPAGVVKVFRDAVAQDFACVAWYHKREGSSMFFRRWLAKLLGIVQGFEGYRKLARIVQWKVRVSEAGEKDLKAVSEWWNFRANASFPYNPNVTNFVARTGLWVVGFAQLVFEPQGPLYHKWWLYCLFVNPLFRRKGIGEALTGAVIEKAKSRGAKTLSLLVHKDNVGAMRLYGKLGFRKEIIPEMEEKLEREKANTGRRRIMLSKDLLL